MKYAWQRLIDKFHSNMNVLHTLEFAKDPEFACEYRRLLSHDLPGKGYVVERTKISPKCWRYRLVEPLPISAGELFPRINENKSPYSI